MNSFGDTEIGKKIFYLIHENNSATSLISHYAQWVKKHPELTKEEIDKEMDDILIQVKKSQDIVDYVYKYFKEKHQKDLVDSDK